ncbi:NAD(P)-dependent oxidoreductase [Kocuria turfanensis]|uniref:NAD(P)-dependent oxidoreductase n=1 Tax=Kocuria turfanensis TaxID=388357 RepID=UPI0007869BCF|nr:NAD(P)H-binding protein [Kocuria turfanensis]
MGGWEDVMRVTVFGVGNEVGQAVVEHLACQGIEVLAFVADPGPSARRWGQGVEVMRGELADPVAVAEAVAWSEAVVNALDPRLDRTVRGGALVEATGHIVTAMQAHQVRRYIGLGGPAAGMHPHERPPMAVRTHRALARALHPERCRQEQQILAVVTGADLDWTIVRFAHRTPGRGRGVNYVGDFGRDQVGIGASAEEIAGFAATQVLSTRFIGAAPAISH